MSYETVEMIVADRERLRAEVEAGRAERAEHERVVRERDDARRQAADDREALMAEIDSARRAALEEGFAEGMEHAAYFIGEFTELVGCQKCGELAPDAAYSIAFMIREESKRYLEFKKSQVVAAAIRAATPQALASRLDLLLSDPDWDDCDKGEAYEVLSELRSEIRSVLELLRIRAENFGDARMALDYARSFPLLAAVAAGLVKEAKP